MKDRNKDLEGKVAIVTGSGAKGGIGFVTAQVLAEAGATVILTGRRIGELEELTNSLKDKGLKVANHLVDIADEKSVEELLLFTKKTFGRLDTLVNNAALTSSHGDQVVGTMSVEAWDQTFASNARGTMLMCKHSLPLLIETGGGSITNLSSGTSLAGDMFYTAYACSKGAINTLTLYLATQYGAQKVRCNALAVGLVKTDRLHEMMPKPMRDLFTANHIIGRLGDLEDVAEVIRFLASDHATWITGQVMGIDGGFYAHVPTSVGLAELMAKMGH
jgi:NAD(P)-dependent dehydrogenase (short-subunit alcohol dehydrogenase family)